jgi:enoyl-[acyl-carrier-protein] reductase (NADH)
MSRRANAEFFTTDVGKALINRIPQRRLLQISDLHAPMLLLASDLCQSITGVVLPVDGGHLVSLL